LLFYDAQAGEGAFHSIDAQGNMAHIKTNSGWPKNLVVIVPGSWNPPQTGLLFYDDVQGVGEFYTVDNQGNIHLLKRHEGWRHTWYHNIFPVGLLGNTGNQSLLFYDAPARDGTFYNVDAQGNLSFVHQESGWRGWSQIIPIFDVSKALPKAPGQEPVLFRNGLLFYDAGNRVGEFYVLDTQGHPNLIQQKQGWRESWTNIIETDMLMLGKAPGGR
jgi:hypothetical protein